MRARSLCAGVLALGSITCASTPRTAALTDVDQVRKEPSVTASEHDSPALWARAESIRMQAEAASRAGDAVSTEILSSEAVASYRRAAASARWILGDMRAHAIEAEAGRLAERTAADETSRIEIDREADDLEAQIAVRREAMLPATSKPTDTARTYARWVAARANASAAGELCEAAGLLSPSAHGLPEAKAALATLNAKIEASSGASASAAGEAPIDASTRARALCLAALTAAKDAVVAGAGAEGAEILAALSAAGFEVRRDERGIVVTFTQEPADQAPFAPHEGAVSASGATRLATVARMAVAHPHFSVLVVAHDLADVRAATPLAHARAASAKQALIDAGLPALRIATLTPGGTLAAFDVTDAKQRPRNERLEVVLVGRE